MITAHPDGATLVVHAKPGARKPGINGVQDGALIAELLRDWLGVKRSQVELLSGPTHRRKVFLVRNVTVDWLAETVALKLVG